MDYKHIIFWLCLVFLSGILAEDPMQDQDSQNSMMKEFINIDDMKGSGDSSDDGADETADNAQNDDSMWEGSGMQDNADIDAESDPEDSDKDSDHDQGSGVQVSGPDYPNFGSDPKSVCKQLQKSIAKRKMKNAYVPKCTDEGLFETVQCLNSYSECWCVDDYGREIVGTKRTHATRESRKKMCDHIDQLIAPTPKRKPGVQTRPEEETPAEGDATEPEDGDNEFFERESEEEIPNSINNMNGGEDQDFESTNLNSNNGNDLQQGTNTEATNGDLIPNMVMKQRGILAGIIGGTLVGLLCAVLLVMFVVYRMRKKDEGSYALDEPRRSPSHHQYHRASNREFYA